MYSAYVIAEPIPHKKPLDSSIFRENLNSRKNRNPKNARQSNPPFKSVNFSFNKTTAITTAIRGARYKRKAEFAREVLLMALI